MTDTQAKEDLNVNNLNFHSVRAPIDFPVDRAEAELETLERLYQRKATLDALIQSLEEYARCRVSAPIVTIPLR